tara:strand:+ start:662 stop:1159 length:498 start_codon:yes stop_codon:yes gene_type:complete
MSIEYKQTLNQAYKIIKVQEQRKFVIYPKNEARTHLNSDEIVDIYGKAKWEIVELINKKFGTNFSHLNWLEKKEDEIAHFINEAGSNSLNYSEFKVPKSFHLWLGKRGFIIGIEQQGKGFNAQKVNERKIKENEGAAFNFYRECKSIVFFDDARDCRIVYLLYLF